jgi:thiol:disulfide interchange protein DsbD
MKKSNLSICKPLQFWILVSFFLQVFMLQAVDTTPLTPYTSSNEEIVSVSLFVEEKTVRPSSTLWACFQFHIAPEWHLYWKNPGDAGAGPTINWTLPEGFKVGEPLWPFPERFEIDSAVVFGYERQMLFLVPIYAPHDISEGSRLRFAADVQWLGCSTLCVPGNAQFAFQLPVSTGESQINQSAKNTFRQARMWLPVESKQAAVRVKDGMLEIEVQSLVPLRQIVSVHFFSEVPESVSTHARVKYNVSDIGKITVQVPLEDAKLPIKGVLVVKDDGADGVKKHAWQISSQGSKGSEASKQVSLSSNQQLEDLEKQVWYRRILQAISEFMHSELVKILLLAFAGGMILNIMPCVLPVVSIKMLHLVELKGSDRFFIAKHSLIYSAGVLVSFWALAGSIFVLQSFGKVVGWGFQLQNPYFVAVLVLVLFILALGMFGVFEFGIALSSTAGAVEQRFHTQKPSLLTSFFSGVLATFIASPCTGPLLGSAIGFTATVHPALSFVIFTALGIGMAFPFLLLAVFPGISKVIPRPGRWMITFKQVMGFFIVATVLWLVWVLDAQTQDLSLLSMLITLFIVSVGTWVYGTWGGYDRVKSTRTLARIIALALVIWGSYMLVMDIKRTKMGSSVKIALTDHWETFSQKKLDQLLQQKEAVFVAVTAKWCLTCQANHAVLETEKVQQAFMRYGVVKLLADWTNGDEEITRYLRSHGRNGVPFYAIYFRDSAKAPIILPELITPEMVVEALNKAYGS